MLSMNCAAPQELIVPKSNTESKDPILQHLLRVVNSRTKKTPLVASCVPVQSSLGCKALSDDDKTESDDEVICISVKRARVS